MTDYHPLFEKWFPLLRWLYSHCHDFTSLFSLAIIDRLTTLADPASPQVCYAIV